MDERLLGRTVGEYRVEGLIGRGGMGEVYHATSTKTGTKVALKAFYGDLGHDFELLKRFRREIEALAKLDHPNIIRVFGAGHDDDVFYYAMEYFPHEHLKVYCKADEPPDLDFVARTARGMAEAFAYYHPKNIVHRDIKPSNVLVTPEGSPKIIDFGLVKLLDQTGITRSDKRIGTLHYMSPEMLLGRPIDGRSDLFQLGLTLYELTMGRKAFQAADLHTLYGAILSGMPPRPAELEQPLPMDWENLIFNCLLKEPDQRYADADAFLRDLDRIAEGKHIRAFRAQEAPATESDMPVQKDVAPEIERRPPRKRLPVASPQADGPPPLVSSSSLRRWVGPGLCVALTALLLFWLLRPTPLAYDIRAFHATPGLTGIHVRWSSRIPYPGAVELQRSGAASAPKRRFNARDREGGTLHEVVVSQLEPGQSYELCVSFPDGRRSASHTVRTATELSLSKPALNLEHGKMLAVVWTTNIPVRSSITYSDGQQDREERLSLHPARQHALRIDPIRLFDPLKDVRLRLVTVEGGEHVMHTPSIDALHVALAKEATRLDQAGTYEELRRLLSEKPGAALDRFLSRLREGKTARLARLFTANGSYFLTPEAPLEGQCRFVEDVRPLLLFDHLLRHRRIETVFRLDGALAPLLKVRPTNLFPDEVPLVVKLKAFLDEEGFLVQAERSPGAERTCQLLHGLLAPRAPFTSRVGFDVDLEIDNLRSARWAQLHLVFTRYPFPIWFEVRINGLLGVPFVHEGDRETPAGMDTLLTMADQLRRGVVQGKVDCYARIPSRLLKPGKNRLSVRLHAHSQDTAHTAWIDFLSLELYR